MRYASSRFRARTQRLKSSASNTWLPGITPSSEFLLALTITMNRISVSPFFVEVAFQYIVVRGYRKSTEGFHLSRVPAAAVPETAVPAPVARERGPVRTRRGLPRSFPIAGRDPPAPHAPDGTRPDRRAR